MKNIVKLNSQLEQKTLPLFCDEDVFRIVLDIYLAHSEEFKCLLPMLGCFHMAKVAEHAIGKYINGCGLENALKISEIFGKKMVEAVLGGTHYVELYKGSRFFQQQLSP